MKKAKKNLRFSIFNLLFCILSFNLSAEAKYSGGTGEPNTPYQIATAADLLTLGGDVNDYNRCFILTADIDLDPCLPGGQVFTTAVIAHDKNNSNYVFDGTAFTGVFNGAGHKIINLTIDTNGVRNDYLGLFGEVNTGEVKNIGMQNASITGRNGALNLGGLVGWNTGSISNCFSTGSVNGVNLNSYYIGGLVGENDGSITNCYSTGVVTGDDFSSVLGGLVGYNNGSITNCYSTGDVNVNGGSCLGGLVGYNGNGNISNSYSSAVIGGDGSHYLGGLVGSAYDGSISSSYFLDVAGPNNGYGTPLTDAQMKQQASFVGWNFINVWKIEKGVSYPYLAWQNKYSGGSGTANDPYQIATAADLLTLGGDVNDYNKCFIMTADIDLDPCLPGGQVFTTAVIAPDIDATTEYFQGIAFTGVFDGAGHKIINLTIDVTFNYYLGLFGEVNTGEVKNIGMQNASVTGRNGACYLGGLVGRNIGSISNCFSTGSVNGVDHFSYYIGGLVGANSGNITNCYSTARLGCGGYGVVLGGGLVGGNYGSIANCYSTGAVIGGAGSFGGLIGYNSGTVIACFWDVNTSGRSYSAGGTGKTTAEMKTQSTFTDAGWDFNDVWTIDEGVDYPKLVWFTNEYSGGKGTANDPYQIETVADLLALAANTYDYDKYFVLTADINFDPCLPGNQVFTTAVIARDTSNSNDVFDGTAFAGVFDGAGYKIINLTIDTSNDYLGLFGDVNGGEIKNIGIENVSITGANDSNYLGGLVGQNNYSTISNSYSTGAVFVGWPSGPLGGLVGKNYYGTISNCFSTVDINGGIDSENVGGLVGLNDNGNISDCFSTGDIIGGGIYKGYIGGLVGGNFNGSISNCYSTGPVVTSRHDSEDIGGLVGYNYFGSISNCYSTGAVIGGDNSWYIGGLVGRSKGSIINCYSTGAVTGGDGSTHLGGLVGYISSGTISSSYFLDVAGPNNGYGTPLTDAQMKQQASFVGWDFVGETINGPNDVWAIKEGVDYPKLVWERVNLIGWYQVDFIDLAVMANWWGHTDCATNDDCDGADIDFSGTVDIADLEVFCNYWLEGL
jgi:hypothetical protein